MPESFQSNGMTTWLWPDGVTWSPDGQDLLYDTIGPGLIVVPISPDTTPTILPQVPPLPPYDMGLTIPIQTWGRQP